MEKLEIDRLHAALGGSLGGMQALQWAIDYPLAMELCLPICASGRLSAMNIAFSTVAREAIMRDPDFQGGRYHETGHGPNIGLSVARMMRAGSRMHKPLGGYPRRASAAFLTRSC